MARVRATKPTNGSSGDVALRVVQEDPQAGIGAELESSTVPVEVGVRSAILELHATDGVCSLCYCLAG